MSTHRREIKSGMIEDGFDRGSGCGEHTSHLVTCIFWTLGSEWRENGVWCGTGTEQWIVLNLRPRSLILCFIWSFFRSGRPPDTFQHEIAVKGLCFDDNLIGTHTPGNEAGHGTEA